LRKARPDPGSCCSRDRGRGANAKDKKIIDDICKKKKIKDRRGFGDYIEAIKGAESRGGADNFTWEQLLDRADYFCECGGK
jgi:hypothetical protein